MWWCLSDLHCLSYSCCSATQCHYRNKRLCFSAADVAACSGQEVLLKEGRENGGRPAHCVGMVRAPETVEVANFLIDRMGRGTLTAELLQPDELVAGIIAQVNPLIMIQSPLP